MQHSKDYTNLDLRPKKTRQKMSTTQRPPPRSPGKLIVQMSGAPGSGKSTVARLLRQSLGGAIIDHDVLRSTLLEPAILPFDQAAKQAYLLQWRLAEDMMKQDVDSVIIDSACNYPEVLKQGRSLGYVYWYVECRVGDLDLLDRRLRARLPMVSQRSAVDCPPTAAQGNGARVGEGSSALFAKWMESPCRPDDDDEGHVIVVDATASPELLHGQILSRLGGRD